MARQLLCVSVKKGGIVIHGDLRALIGRSFELFGVPCALKLQWVGTEGRGTEDERSLLSVEFSAPEEWLKEPLQLQIPIAAAQLPELHHIIREAVHHQLLKLAEGATLDNRRRPE